MSHSIHPSHCSPRFPGPRSSISIACLPLMPSSSSLEGNNKRKSDMTPNSNKSLFSSSGPRPSPEGGNRKRRDHFHQPLVHGSTLIHVLISRKHCFHLQAGGGGSLFAARFLPEAVNGKDSNPSARRELTSPPGHKSISGRRRLLAAGRSLSVRSGGLGRCVELIDAPFPGFHLEIRWTDGDPSTGS